MKSLMMLTLFISLPVMAESPFKIKKAYGGGPMEGDTAARSGVLDANIENERAQEEQQRMEEEKEEKKKSKSSNLELEDDKDAINTAPAPSATPSTTPAPSSP